MNFILPKISVIIPIYNVEKYLSKCLDSVINQTYKNLEIILINDGSTDKSGDICDYYANKDNRIVAIHQENQGTAVTRNHGLDIAAGDYIGFVDSDDWIEPDMYYTLCNNIIAYNADISVCNFSYVYQNGDGERIECDANGVPAKTILENDDKMDHYFNFIVYSVVPWNKLYNKKLFNEIRYPRDKIFDDAFTTHKLIDKSNRVVALPDYKYYYVQRNGSIMKQHFALNQFERIEASIERYCDIAMKYPKTENICRRYIFIELLICVYKAVADDVIDMYAEEIRAAVKKVQEYSRDGCGLSKREEAKLDFIFKRYT